MSMIRKSKGITVDKLTKKPSGPAPKVPIEKILDYRANGMTYEEIGLLTNCSKQNISKRLEKYERESNALRVYKDNRSDVLASHQARILSSVDKSVIDKSSLLQRITSFGILYDKERTELGLVNNITGVFSSIIREAHSSSIPITNQEPAAIPQDIDIAAPDNEPEKEN